MTKENSKNMKETEIIKEKIKYVRDNPNIEEIYYDLLKDLDCDDFGTGFLYNMNQWEIAKYKYSFNWRKCYE